ncbi:hypothetical protein IVB18_47725 [Bradyrhizobium sp. 186]|uniref:hypothetical protein n=1 Tax=Bradyrhizobium sp. 186 TaxID=2782654 RepID=UPI0020009326|nr:hypothetical protein [Bradyrhizobium sp. 186]UPK35549.1 hypothetical protein IVB18_47725 [Bradyrhizobium sp. 186]
MKPEEYFLDQIAEMKRAWDAGFKPALINTVRLCGPNNWPLPQWAYEEIVHHLMESYGGKPKSAGRRGYSGGVRGAAALDAKHYIRWNWASYWLENRKSLLGSRATRDDAFKRVEALLADAQSPARTSAKAVEKSYIKVEKDIRAGRGDRYFLAAGVPLPIAK